MTGLSAEDPKDAEAGLASVVVERPADGIAVAVVAGEVDMITAPTLEREVAALLGERPRLLVIDLAEVRFFSSAGLAVLALAHRQADEGTRVRVVANQPAVLRPIELTGMTDDMVIVSSRKAAIDE